MYNMTSKELVVLSNRVSSSSPMQPDTPIAYANDLDIASDGTIYFTDSVNISTHRWAGAWGTTHPKAVRLAAQTQSSCNQQLTLRPALFRHSTTFILGPITGSFLC